MLANFYIKYCTWFASRERPHPERLLDIGCDNGILTCFYAYLYPETEIVGIDRSEAGIRCADELEERLGLSNVKFQTMDFSKVNESYSNHSFDMVTSVRCLHEIMGTIPFPIYWSLEGYLEKIPSKLDYHYTETIESVMKEDGEYISAERLESPAAVGQWANLHLQWTSSGFIDFHETGTSYKIPVIVANKNDTGMETMDGIRGTIYKEYRVGY